MKLPQSYEALSYLTDPGKKPHCFEGEPNVTLTCSYEPWDMEVPKGYRTERGSEMRCMTYSSYDLPVVRYYENGFVQILDGSGSRLHELLPDVLVVLERPDYNAPIWRLRPLYQDDRYRDFTSFPIDFWAAWDAMNSVRKRMLV